MQTKCQESTPDVSFVPDMTELTTLCGDIRSAVVAKPLQPFSDIIIEFLAAVSKTLMSSPFARKYPDVTTFGFFCREGNINRIKSSYNGKVDNRIGRGLIFHVAPSNVPVNFAYSLISGLLAGNVNIVKASSRDFEQTRIICNFFKQVLKQDRFEPLRAFITVVMYDHDRQDMTEYFSSRCNVRIIWGGDRTIESVRRAPIPPRSFDVTFADRYSLAVINPVKLIEIQDDKKALQTLAQNFYNDTYLFDQNACTSPHLIYWFGDKASTYKAQNIFWTAVYENIKDRYIVEPVIAVNKIVAAERTAIAIPGSISVKGTDNRIVRVEVPELSYQMPKLREAGGFFHEYCSSSLEELAPVIDEKYQTLSYFGCDPIELRNFVLARGLKGIDRVVPIGHTTDWMMTWDGYDLIETVSRDIIAI